MRKQPRTKRRGLLLLSTALALSAIPVSAQTADDLEAVVTTDKGVFRFEFVPGGAAKHAEQFILRARQGYYNGSAFHRVVAEGMIQGGDPLLKNPKTARNLWGSGGLSLLPDEPSTLKHDRGVVSTVSIPNKPGSDGAQFFICVVPQPSLDGHYASFARVTEGMDVVENISRVPAGKDGITEKPVQIVSITIEPKKREPFLSASLNDMRRTVTLKTNLGNLKIRMEPDWAPENVRAFLKLTSAGWYNGTVFHRIVKGFVAQGGTPARPVAADRWVHPIPGEFGAGVKHVAGIVSMAHGDDPNSAATSFFLVLGDSPHLDGQYSAFGRVVEGMDVLQIIGTQEVDGETPKTHVDLIEATIDQ